ncbi:MAG: LPS assembly lipoprotein LptE [Campylobacteraceae bacterium]
MKKYLLALFCIIFVGCGYTPTAKLAKNVLGDKVYVDVAMSRVDPQNTVLIKDAISAALVDRFGSKIVSKNEANSFIYVSLKNIKFSPLAYDTNGYVISYRTVVTLKIDYTLSSNEKGSINTEGEYDFPIIADSVISDSKRFEAIKYASEDALDEFTAFIAIKGLQNKKANTE